MKSNSKMTSTEFPFLQSADHKVLGTEFCSGYSDEYGEWNTGFYCPQPQSESSSQVAVVSCCGTPTYKYCCTGTVNGNVNASVSGESHHINLESSLTSPSGGGAFGETAATTLVDFGPFLIETPLLLSGIVCGAVMSLVFITFGLCYYCSCCILHQKRTASTTTVTGRVPMRAIGGGGPGNLTLYRLGLGSPSTISATNTTTSSSGLGSSITNGSGHARAPPPGSTYPPNTLVNLTNSLPSSSSTPLLEMVGVGGTDFVYSPNQWQTENVYNQLCGASASVASASASSSGVYSNPSSSPYAYAYTHPHPCPMPAMAMAYPYATSACPYPFVHGNMLGSLLSPYAHAYPSPVSMSNNSWCSNPGANRNITGNANGYPPPQPPQLPPPPPYSYSQQVHSRGSNPNSQSRVGPGQGHQSNSPSLSATNYATATATATANRIKPTPAEILLYERILRALLKDRDINSDRNGRSALNSNSSRCATSTTTSRSTSGVSAACTLPKATTNKNHVQQQQQQSGPNSSSVSLCAKSVNTIPSQSQQPEPESSAIPRDHVSASRPS